MAVNVETMMYVREKPWHGLGVEVSEAPNSEDALRDWIGMSVRKTCSIPEVALVG